MYFRSDTQDPNENINEYLDKDPIETRHKHHHDKCCNEAHYMSYYPCYQCCPMMHVNQTIPMQMMPNQTMPMQNEPSKTQQMPISYNSEREEEDLMYRRHRPYPYYPYAPHPYYPHYPYHYRPYPYFWYYRPWWMFF